MRALPARGEIRIFNRSHYEEMLVVRVHPETSSGRNRPRKRGATTYGHADTGRSRLGTLPRGQRIQDRQALFASVQRGAARPVPETAGPTGENWEFSSSDTRERERWDDYQKAFSEMLSNTSTEWALVRDPRRSQVVRKDLCRRVLANALIEINPQYPKVGPTCCESLRRRGRTSGHRPPRAPHPTPYANRC